MERSIGKDEKITFDIREHIGVIEKQDNGWTRELNIVSWNGGKPKWDLRTWSPDHTRMTRGITLTEDEGRTLLNLLGDYYCSREVMSNRPKGNNEYER